MADSAFEVDNFKFIECVQENPAIWDKDHVDYGKKTAHKEEIWANIAEDIFSNWLDMTPNEKEKQLAHIKNKWRHFRDYYTKYMNWIRKGKRVRKYAYADCLSFLKPHILKWRRTRYLEDKKQQVKIESCEEDKREEDGEPMNVVDAFISEVPPVQQASSSSLLPTRKHYTPHVEQPTSLMRRAENGVQIQQPLALLRQIDEFDLDMAFLLSILPDYKRLNYEQKIDFRMYTLGFFKRVSPNIS